MLKMAMIIATGIALSFAGACGAQWCFDQRCECMGIWCGVFSGFSMIMSVAALICAPTGDSTRC